MKAGDIVAILVPDEERKDRVKVDGPYRVTNMAKVDWKHRDKPLHQSTQLLEILNEQANEVTIIVRSAVTTIIDAEFVEKTTHIVVTKPALEQVYVSRTE